MGDALVVSAAELNMAEIYGEMILPTWAFWLTPTWAFWPRYLGVLAHPVPSLSLYLSLSDSFRGDLRYG